MLDPKDRIRTDYRSYKNGFYPVYVHLCKICNIEMYLTATQEKNRGCSECASCKNIKRGIVRKNNKILKKGVPKPPSRKKRMSQRKYFPKIGDVFGRLTLIEIIPPDNILTFTRYKCLCICGRECFAKLNRLYSGRIKSCGCYSLDKAKLLGKANALKEGNSTENSLLGAYKNAAKKRNLSFELTKDQLEEISKQTKKNKPITERIQNFDDVLNELQIAEFILPYSNPKTKEERAINATAKLFKIVEAYNEGTTLDWKNINECKWIPYKYFSSGGSGVVLCDFWLDYLPGTSGVYYKNKQLAEDGYFKFKDIYEDYWM